MKKNTPPASRLKTILQGVCAVLQGYAVTASNEAKRHDTKDGELFAISNIFLPTPDEPKAEEWKMLAPYGDHQHAAGMQRFDRKAADTIVANFQSLTARAKRTFALGGDIPFYIGHPDDPRYANRAGNTDTRAYGWVENLEAREDGLYFTARWSDEGQHILSNAHYRYLSPRWVMKPLARGVFSPHTLVSIGLTNQPNIPVPAISNQTQLNNIMNDLLKALLLKLGFSEEQIEALASGDENAELTQEAITTKLDELMDTAERTPELANELKEKDKALVSANELLKAAKTKAEADLIAANQAADALKATVAAHEAAAAVSDGRILLSEEVTTANSLAAAEDFDAAVAALKAKQPAVKTHSRTGHLGGQQHITMSNAMQEFQTLVVKREKETGETHSTAWANVKRSDEGKQLLSLVENKA